MAPDELEAKVLSLEPKARARLAEKLLESLENLSPKENAKLWAEEAQRRDEEWDADTEVTSENVILNARKQLK